MATKQLMVLVMTIFGIGMFLVRFSDGCNSNCPECSTSASNDNQYMQRPVVKSYANSALTSLETLRTGEMLVSENGKFFAVMQADCNFVIYKSSNFTIYNIKWSSHTTGRGFGCKLTYIKEASSGCSGNTVSYNFVIAEDFTRSCKNVLFAFPANCALNDCSTLLLDTTGALCEFSGSGVALWCTTTTAYNDF